MAALERAEVVDGHDRVRVPGRPVGDVDDHRRGDQLRRLQVGGQPVPRDECPGASTWVPMCSIMVHFCM